MAAPRPGRRLRNDHPDPMSAQGWICYEQPLSERVRTMLRLEFLFERAHHSMAGDDRLSSRGTVDSLIDVMSVLGRADLKKELIKELERHALTLDSLSRNPNVDPQRLQEVQDRVDGLLTRLKGAELGFGQDLRNNELFNAIRQRSSIPAGTSSCQPRPCRSACQGMRRASRTSDQLRKRRRDRVPPGPSSRCAGRGRQSCAGCPGVVSIGVSSISPSSQIVASASPCVFLTCGFCHVSYYKVTKDLTASTEPLTCRS